MKRLLGSLYVILLMLALPIDWSLAATEATSFVDDLGKKVLAVVNDPKLAADERETRIDKLAADAFDVPRIARFVLGRHWATASPSEREQFIKVFERYIVHIYGARFSQYHDAKFAVLGEQTQGPDRTLVRTRIERVGEQPINVNWWVDKKGSTFKIVDVNIEGVSLLLSYREEFASVIDRNGGQISALIERLREATRG